MEHRSIMDKNIAHIGKIVSKDLHNLLREYKPVSSWAKLLHFLCYERELNKKYTPSGDENLMKHLSLFPDTEKIDSNVMKSLQYTLKANMQP